MTIFLPAPSTGGHWGWFILTMYCALLRGLLSWWERLVKISHVRRSSASMVLAQFIIASCKTLAQWVKRNQIVIGLGLVIFKTWLYVEDKVLIMLSLFSMKRNDRLPYKISCINLCYLNMWVSLFSYVIIGISFVEWDLDFWLNS